MTQDERVMEAMKVLEALAEESRPMFQSLRDMVRVWEQVAQAERTRILQAFGPLVVRKYHRVYPPAKRGRARRQGWRPR